MLQSKLKWYKDMTKKEQKEADESAVNSSKKWGIPLPNGWNHGDNYLLDLCPVCGHTAEDAILINESGEEFRTITCKCAKCNTIFQYHG